MLSIDIGKITAIAINAGDIIMQHYEGVISFEKKSDESPVTAADLAANNYIVEQLKACAPDIPIVSEENAEADNIAASKSPHFWLVDPLDGTKSYIKKTGEFTVNIALIEGNIPVFGVIYIPVQEMLYYTDKNGNAYKQARGEEAKQIQARNTPDEGATVVASKSHLTKETDDYIKTLTVASLTSAGSSLKFCLVAEGAADVYPRFGRTMEWDTAAGHAIVLAAGGAVEKTDNTPLEYGKEGLDNPYFIVFGKR